jgi:hypothetical protein
MPNDDTQSLLLHSLYGTPAQPLGRLLQQYSIENRVYKNVQINLDGYTFRNCAFIGCELHARKGNFHIVDCHISNCTAYFVGNALRIVKLLSIFLESWGNLNVGLRAKIEPDGGATIS